VENSHKLYFGWHVAVIDVNINDIISHTKETYRIRDVVQKTRYGIGKRLVSSQQGYI
jgi:hypothetical protein